jgi:hypothetical protein
MSICQMNLRRKKNLQIVFFIIISLGFSTVETNWDRDVLTCRDVLFQNVEMSFSECRDVLFQNVETDSQSRPCQKLRLIETLGDTLCRDLSRCRFKTVKTWFFKCRDQESRSRSRRDKSRPPGLYSIYPWMFREIFVLKDDTIRRRFF